MKTSLKFQNIGYKTCLYKLPKKKFSSDHGRSLTLNNYNQILLHIFNKKQLIHITEIVTANSKLPNKILIARELNENKFISKCFNISIIHLLFVLMRAIRIISVSFSKIKMESIKAITWAQQNLFLSFNWK